MFYPWFPLQSPETTTLDISGRNQTEKLCSVIECGMRLHFLISLTFNTPNSMCFVFFCVREWWQHFYLGSMIEHLESNTDAAKETPYYIF